MEPWLIVIAILGVATMAAIAVAWRQRAALAEAVGRDARQRSEIERADAEAHVRRSEAAVLLDLLDQGVLLIDKDRRVQTANTAAHRLLGRTGDTLVGRTVMESFLDPGAEAVVDEGYTTGMAATELRLGAPDGPMLMVQTRPTGSGHLWMVVEDVSELRRLQRIRTEFIDNLSHELRTPLTTVSLLAETLSRDAEIAGDGVPPRMRDRIAKIEVETGHLVQMVNELMDLSRIERGGTLRLTDDVDLGQLAIGSAERLRLFADRQGVTLHATTEPGLPRVRGDEGRLAQVVINLLHNAVKFSPDGGDVTVWAHVDGPEVVVEVADHGVGIPTSDQARVFERFYKVDRARARADASGGGTGLGLAIARHVVEQHGGRLWLTSTEGVGSTFSFAIPIATPDRTDA